MRKVGDSYRVGGWGGEIKMDTLPYSISVYSPATLLNGVEENVTPNIFVHKKKEIFERGLK